MAIKQRYCWYCGDDMGLIDSRYYERGDTCGKRECERGGEKCTGPRARRGPRTLRSSLGY